MFESKVLVEVYEVEVRPKSKICSLKSETKVQNPWSEVQNSKYDVQSLSKVQSGSLKSEVFLRSLSKVLQLSEVRRCPKSDSEG